MPLLLSKSSLRYSIWISSGLHLENFGILRPMKIKFISISAALLLLMSLVPQSASAVKAQKMKRYTVTMQKAHLPVAPNKGTDDYRCFLLDPKVTEDSIIRAIEFIPQQKAMVHHAIVADMDRLFIA
jgi:hypothetical protein